MAKKSLIKKNEKILLLSQKNSETRVLARAILSSNTNSIDEKFKAQRYLERTRLFATNRYRNRCKLTGRPRAYRGKFGMCGYKLRELAGFGMIMGVIKSN